MKDENLEDNLEEIKKENIAENPEQNKTQEEAAVEEDKKEIIEEIKTHREELIVRTDKKNTRKNIIIILIAILISTLMLFAVIALLNRFNINVYKNVYVLGENVSNYTVEELQKLFETKSNYIKTKKMDIYQEHKDIYDLSAESIDFNIDIQKTCDKVINFGRDGNIFENNFKIIKALILKKEILPEYTYSEEKLNTVIKNIDLTVEGRCIEDTYSVDEIKHVLNITKGTTGNSIEHETLKNDVLNILKLDEIPNYELKIMTKKPDDLDLEKLYLAVKRSSEDARIDEKVSPPAFIKEKVGYDLEISKLKELLDLPENKEEGKNIEYKLTIIEPKVKLADITYTLYNDKLAGYTTYFSSSDKNRAKNLEIALGYLNGAIIMPGETFSYNNKVGDIVASKGYLPAATFKGGTVVNEIGGGVCQTSSTLYNTALMSNLEIVERHQHGLPVGYVPPSRDATIYVGLLDLKFKNTRNYPVKIVTSFSPAGNMNISIYGTKEKDEYEITLTSNIINYIPFSTKYIADNNAYKDTSYIVSKGVNGYTSQSFITKKLNGSVISSGLLSKDTYKAQQQIVNYGTKIKNVSIY